MTRTRIFGICTLWPWPWRYDLPLDHGQQLYDYPDPTWQWGIMARAWIWVCVHCDLDIRDITFGQDNGTPFWVMDNNHVKYPYKTWQWGVVAQTWIFGISALWPWPWVKIMTHPWVMDNNSVKYYPVQLGSEELWPGHGFRVCVHCDLDLGNMTFGQSHDTPLGHWQQLCQILSRLDKWVGSYGLGTMWTDGQTDGQGDSNIPTKLCLRGGGGGVYNKIR